MGSKSTDAAGALRAWLRESGLRIGDKLPGERELAEQIGMGRSALRTLLEALENEGVLERRPQSGTFLLRIPAPGVSGMKVALIAPLRLRHDEPVGETGIDAALALLPSTTAGSIHASRSGGQRH